MPRVSFMAKKKPASGQTSEPARRRTVDLDPDLARKIAMVAGANGVSVPTWVNNALRPIVEDAVKEVAKSMGIPLKE